MDGEPRDVWKLLDELDEVHGIFVDDMSDHDYGRHLEVTKLTAEIRAQLRGD